jgi:tRNA pseudouridine38-40 synthase
LNAYKLIIAYDGTDYHGWQKQEDSPTIAGVLEKAFLQAFKRPVIVIGASRTDTGVHALGQVVLVETDLMVDSATLCRAWNNVLPSSIVIRSAEQAPPSFHPQQQVRYKIYYYYLSLVRPLPFLSRYCWYYHQAIDQVKLYDGLQVFVGTHDFRSFCTVDNDEERSTIRTINALDVDYYARFNMLRIRVQGHSFLHYMIRRLVGAAVTVAAHVDLDRTTLQDALAEKDPRQTLPKAPASGLILRTIAYKYEELHESTNF